jgi:co-chaperonin GroES (HSP10)
MNPKPIRGELIVIVDKEDKYTHTISGTDIKLFIDKDFGWNEREKNAVNAVVKDPGKTNLKEGTRIVCWHNSFTEHSLIDTIDTDEDSVYGGKKKLQLHKLNPKHVFFWLDDDNPTPMPGYIIAKRIYHKRKSESIIITELSEEKEQNRVVVVNVVNNCDTNSNEKVDEYAIKPNDVVIIETMADYEVVYADKGREHRLIRVKEEDIIAIDHGYELTENHKTGV